MERPCANLKYSELTERIIGVFFDVYNELGFGFLESTYSTAMMLALQDCGLEVARQVAIPVWFRGKTIGPYFADILVEHKVLLELKAGHCLEPAHEAQLLHYLRATEIEIGLLLNFGLRPQFRRLIFDNERKKNPWKSVQICGRGFRMRIGYGFDSHELRVRAPLKISGDKRKEIRENPCKSVAKVSA